jgi:hypothetical protein
MGRPAGQACLAVHNMDRIWCHIAMRPFIAIKFTGDLRDVPE